MRWLSVTIIAAILLSLPLFFGARLLSIVPQSIVPQSIVKQAAIFTNTIIPKIPEPISADTLAELINNIRSTQNLKSLALGQKTCLMADSALENQSLNPSIIAQKCPECRLVQIARFAQPLDVKQFESQVFSNASMSAYFLSPTLTNMCVATSGSEAVIALVEAKPAQVSKSLPPAKFFTEDQLWQALTTYRHSQNRTELQQDENVCKYARKRVQDQLDLLAKHLDPKDYPVAGKYPLDAHQGFKADGDSGVLFEITKKTHVAENLAYWPSAEDPIHVIEWGWDTSTEGHRETQISNEWTSACLSGKDGFYVAIFAN